jgi:hypothetical protein
MGGPLLRHHFYFGKAHYGCNAEEGCGPRRHHRSHEANASGPELRRQPLFYALTENVLDIAQHDDLPHKLERSNVVATERARDRRPAGGSSSRRAQRRRLARPVQRTSSSSAGLRAKAGASGRASLPVAGPLRVSKLDKRSRALLSAPLPLGPVLVDRDSWPM